MNFASALTAPSMFGPWMSGPSWAGWRAVLKGAYAAPMTGDEHAFFRTVAKREPPARRVKELWVVAGRRAGKDSVASIIATHFALGDYHARLRPGERAVVMCLAVDREQAKIVLGYIKGYFQEIPGLADLIGRETQYGFEVGDEVEVVVATNNFRLVRGRTLVCVIFDEVAFWRSDDAANPDTETYNAARPGLATLAPDSILIGISSPYRKAGLLYSKWKAHFGRDSDDEVLVIQAPTLTLNPSLDPAIIADALAEDPAKAGAEWLAEWRDDIGAFLDRALVEAAVETGRLVRPPVAGIRYVAFCDPSGGSSDSMTLAIAHADGAGAARTGVLDCLVERTAPFNPTEVAAEMASTLKTYGLKQVEGDRYAAQWVVSAFQSNGITYKHSERDRSAIYLDAIPLFTSGRASLLDIKKLVAQFANLERRTSSSGKDRIDHSPGAHDDCANAAAGALTLAAGGKQPLIVSDDALAASRCASHYGRTAESRALREQYNARYR